MASVWKHPNSQYYVACFRDLDRRQRRITTKETDRKKAQAIASEWEAIIRQKRNKAHIEQIIKTLHDESISRPEFGIGISVKAYADRWLAKKEPQVEEKTTIYYESAIRKFLKWLYARADRPITELRRVDIADYRGFLGRQRIATSTANHYLMGVRVMLWAAYREGVLYKNPAEFLEDIRELDL